jgi:hypothetical protein
MAQNTTWTFTFTVQGVAGEQMEEALIGAICKAGKSLTSGDHRHPRFPGFFCYQPILDADGEVIGTVSFDTRDED